MIKYFLFAILFVDSHGEFNFCKDENVTSKPVIDYCKSQNGTLEGRCCYAENSKNLLAIDLIEMNFDQVPDLIEYVNLTVIDLRLNSQLKPSQSNDFLGLKSLDYLLLPEQYSCPGDKHVWKDIHLIDDPKGIVCQHQKDLCINSSDICTQPSSYCLPNGPNHFLCLCQDGYYGYKCLRNSHFPAGSFLGSVIAITLILSTFFYLTQRKNVKKD
jgi:hypothetical protein